MATVHILSIDGIGGEVLPGALESVAIEGGLTTLGYSANRKTTIDVTDLIVPQASIRSLNMWTMALSSGWVRWSISQSKTHSPDQTRIFETSLRTSKFHLLKRPNLPVRLASEVDVIQTFAERKHATPAQIALAWLLAQKPWIVPIPGTTKLHRLNGNTGSTLVELTANDLQELDGATAKITVEGDRYPPDLERMTYR